MMSFSAKVKDELARQETKARHCMLAELSGIFLLTGGRDSLEMRTENLTVARKSYMLLNGVFQSTIDVGTRRHSSPGSVATYYLAVREKEQLERILKALKRMDEWGNIQGDLLQSQYRLLQNTCCKRAFLRGAFLAAGSVTNPEKAYHLELAVLSVEAAKCLQEVMVFFGLDAKIILRKKYHVVYLKEGEQIADFLNITGAHVALMELENIRILKEIRNSVNRQVNCETANISKTVTAAAKQIEDIRYIECNMGLRQLASGLREIAELRLEYPDSSMQELGRMLQPPIGKSGVNHRLRKLGIIAEQLREKS